MEIVAGIAPPLRGRHILALDVASVPYPNMYGSFSRYHSATTCDSILKELTYPIKVLSTDANSGQEIVATKNVIRCLSAYVHFEIHAFGHFQFTRVSDTMKMQAMLVLALLFAIAIRSSVASGDESFAGSGSISDDLSANSTDSSAPSVDFSSELFNFQVSYLVGVRNAPNTTNYCSGVLVAPKFVLTSVTCMRLLQRPVPKEQWVSIGSIYKTLEIGGERIQVIKQHVPPNYDIFTDVMLLELKTASTQMPAYVAPSNHTTYLTAGESNIVYGWNDGKGYATTAQREHSYKTTMRVGDALDCLTLYRITSSEFCAMSNDQSDACHVNDGSPMIVTVGWKNTVVGIVTDRSGCMQPGMETGFYNVMLAQNWISSITGI